jgi:hypothetical protein
LERVKNKTQPACLNPTEEIAEQEQPIQLVQSLNENPVIQLFHGDLVDKGRKNSNESVDAILAHAGKIAFLLTKLDSVENLSLKAQPRPSNPNSTLNIP